MNIDYGFISHSNQIPFNDDDLEYSQSKINQTNLNQPKNKIQKIVDHQSNLQDINEDPYYKTLIMIYDYFNHKVSFEKSLSPKTPSIRYSNYPRISQLNEEC